jgi:hypothetical protein
MGSDSEIVQRLQVPVSTRSSSLRRELRVDGADRLPGMDAVLEVVPVVVAVERCYKRLRLRELDLIAQCLKEALDVLGYVFLDGGRTAGENVRMRCRS